VAIDRDETLRKAEKLLRQGNLPGAIAEYVRVAEEFPADVNTLNKLAELYQRAGETDRAVVTYTRVADHWLREGTYGKAAAHYKKVLKLRPNDEAALLQLVQASIRQGSLVEAKGYLKIARDAREARGDRPGADQLTLQLADLDPSDFDAKLKGIRVRLAQEPSRSMVAEVRAAIAELEKAGRGAEAEDLLAGLIKLDPDNVDARVQVVEAAMRRGDDAAARAALPASPEESHRPEVVALAAELELKAGRLDAARPLLQRLLSLDRSRGRVTIRELGERLRAHDLSIAYACVEAVVDDQTTAREFVDASEALKRFLKVSKHHVPALLRLVEVAVDGDLDKDVTLAQRQLADAYLAEGEAMKARVIAEDLLSRDPRSLSERKRLHRALVALGEDDPDGIITELLSDQLGLGDDLTPLDDTEDDEAANEIEAAASEAGEETSGPDARADGHVDDQAGAHAGADAPGVVAAGVADAGVDAEAVAADAVAAGAVAGDAESAASTAGVDLDPAGDRGDGRDADDRDADDPDDRVLGAIAAGDGDGAPAAAAAAPSDAHDELAPGDTLATLDAFTPPDPLDAIGPLGGVEPPPAEALFAPPPDALFPAPIEPAGAPELPELADLGAVAAAHGTDAVPSPEVLGGAPEPEAAAWAAPASESDQGIAFEPEPVDFLPTDPDLSIGDPELALGGGLGAEHGPDLLPVIEPPAPGHVSPDVPLGADDQEPDDDTEIDLTGALNALAKNGVSISEALDAAMPPPSASANAGGQAGQKSGGLPAGAEAFTPAGAGGAPGKDAAHANGAGDDIDLERVFDGLRNQAAGDMVEMAQPDQSLRLLSMADTYQAAGMFDEARAALEQVATDTRHRFRAAASLGRLFWQQGDADAALRWMQLASEAPAPDPEAGRALMYELGEKLEQTGETTRALAVFLELLGEQEGYRDVQQRVDRLSRVQAG
jgi:tetratricopeptide (TPR) repeat protein